MKSYVDAKYSSFRLNEIFSLKHSYSLYLIQPFCEPEYLSSESIFFLKWNTIIHAFRFSGFFLLIHSYLQGIALEIWRV